MLNFKAILCNALHYALNLGASYTAGLASIQDLLTPLVRMEHTASTVFYLYAAFSNAFHDWNIIKSQSFWGSAPDPDGGAYSAPPYPLAGAGGVPPSRTHPSHTHHPCSPPPPPPPKTWIRRCVMYPSISQLRNKIQISEVSTELSLY